MSEERDHDRLGAGRVGFSAYADDTPRQHSTLDEIARRQDGTPDERPQLAVSPPRRPHGDLNTRAKRSGFGVGAAVLVAIVGGLAGFLVRGSLDGQTAGPRKPAEAEPANSGPARTLPVEVFTPPAPPPPAATTLLEVLPKRAAAPTRPLAPGQGHQSPEGRAASANVDGAPVGNSITVSADAPAPPPPAPSCDGSRAERMVCGDDGLRRADDRMQMAYEDAIAAGVPARFLRDEQRDWLAIREDAAGHSRDAIASVYRQRIQELREMARRGWSDASENEPSDPRQD